MSDINFDRLVEAYVERREKLNRLETEHKERIAPIRKELETLEAGMQRLLADSGATSAKTPHGTCYRQKWTKAQVRDWQTAFDYIRANERWDLLTRAVNKTAVVEDLEAGREVPGVEVQTGYKVNVRRT